MPSSWLGTSADHSAGSQIYVLGLRNPWQFGFAPGTNKLWVGDVQRDAREELDLLGPGDNVGWSWREASLPGPRTGHQINGAAEADATLVAPVVDPKRFFKIPIEEEQPARTLATRMHAGEQRGPSYCASHDFP